MNIHAYRVRIPERQIDAIESPHRLRKDHIGFHLDEDLTFSTEALQSYAFSRWESVLYDAMVVAATVEFADKSVKPPPRGWARRIALRIPVHDPKRWMAPSVSDTLHDALGFLTGDFWTISFVKRSSKALAPSQEHLDLGVPTEAVIAYSEGISARSSRLLLSPIRSRLTSRIAKRPREAEASNSPLSAVLRLIFPKPKRY
jgi:hypothetical protein